ncbi:hypothetical protein [Paraburkholderia pallida]|uniref:Restriction endonuclease n=1 Tax=Paraburkholderia pallida TaxID=2547399 RepID=A0A4P7D6B6_9BURK|nr:hypothetical protein [Paraburkholderia pallida]QBR03678.1 hypothetical protein E1956_41985 [Paraburkholderia pallida]
MNTKKNEARRTRSGSARRGSATDGSKSRRERTIESGAAEVRGQIENADDGPIWWEKTVEYIFALRYMKEYTLICPLSGKHERAGDVLSNAGTKWCLIEFKRFGPPKSTHQAENSESEKNGVTGTNSENRKFLGSTEAQTTFHLYRHELGKKNNEIPFHSIVHGKPVENKITLGAHDYWDPTKGRETEKLFTLGTEYATFKNYVDLFVKAKSGNSGAGGGSGSGGGGGGNTPRDDTDPSNTPGTGVAPEPEAIDYTNVIAVTQHHELFCCPLSDFMVMLHDTGGNPPPPDDEDGGIADTPKAPRDFGSGGVAKQFDPVTVIGRDPEKERSWVNDETMADAT